MVRSQPFLSPFAVVHFWPNLMFLESLADYLKFFLCVSGPVTASGDRKGGPPDRRRDFCRGGGRAGLAPWDCNCPCDCCEARLFMDYPCACDHCRSNFFYMISQDCYCLCCSYRFVAAYTSTCKCYCCVVNRAFNKPQYWLKKYTGVHPLS